MDREELHSGPSGDISVPVSRSRPSTPCSAPFPPLRLPFARPALATLAWGERTIQPAGVPRPRRGAGAAAGGGSRGWWRSCGRAGGGDRDAWGAAAGGGGECRGSSVPRGGWRPLGPPGWKEAAGPRGDGERVPLGYAEPGLTLAAVFVFWATFMGVCATITPIHSPASRPFACLTGEGGGVLPCRPVLQGLRSW